MNYKKNKKIATKIGCCCLPRNNSKLEWIGDKYWLYVAWYSVRFGEDTRNWFVLLVVREVTEILLQTIALYNYNGLNLFNENQSILAHEQSAIKLFAILLSCNAILVGFLWIFYTLNGTFCRGLLFKQIIFVVDTIFDAFYALFPISAISAQIGFNLSVGIGALQTTNLLSFCICFFFSLLQLPHFLCFSFFYFLFFDGCCC